MTPLVTDAESLTLLVAHPEWAAYDPAIRADWLAQASTYFRANYRCEDVDLTDATTAPDAVREAVAQLARLAAADTSGLWTTTDASAGGGELIEKTVQAGTVRRTLRYQAGTGASAQGTTTDRFPLVSALVFGTCVLNTSGVRSGLVPLGRN